MSEIIPVPVELVQRALALGERDVAATEALRESVETYRAEVKPIVDAYGAMLKARAEALARAEAERLEGRTVVEKGKSEIVQLLTGRVAIAIYTAVAILFANYAAGMAGIAPPPIREALAPEAPHVVP